MKYRFITIQHLLMSVVYAGIIFGMVSCNKQELEDLKKENAELLSKIDVGTVTIAELEAQKVELENQMGEANANVESLQSDIAKLESLIACKYVERYMVSIFANEDFATYRWQHDYNANMQLVKSTFKTSDANDFAYSQILEGTKGRPAVNEYLHTYTAGGVLTTSTSNEQEISWTFEDGKIIGIQVKSLINQGQIGVYTIDIVSGNIITNDYQAADGYTQNSTYTYNEDNLVSKIEGQEGGNSFVETFEYDATFNMIKYSFALNGVETKAKEWDYLNGNIAYYYGFENDIETEIWIEYDEDGSGSYYVIVENRHKIETTANPLLEKIERKYDADKNLIYKWEQLGAEKPEAVGYAYNTSGYETMATTYYYAANGTQWFVEMEIKKESARNTQNQVTDEVYTETTYNTAGTITDTYIYAFENIVWSNDESYKLEYTDVVYTTYPDVLFSRVDYKYVQKGSRYFQQYYAEYNVSGASPLLTYTWKITAFYELAPHAPQTAIEKEYDALGAETISTDFTNDVNVANEAEWVWL